MREWLPVGSLLMGIAALMLSLWNSFTLADLSGRVTALQQMRSQPPQIARREADEPPQKPVRGSKLRELAAARSPAFGAAAEEDDPSLGEAPDIEERIASAVAAAEERRESERGERFADVLRAQVEEFIEEEGISSSTADKLFAILDKRSETFRSTKEALRNGEMNFMDARQELEDTRTRTTAELEKLLGHDKASRLDERLWAERRPPIP